MSTKQRCPHCQFINKVAGIYQSTHGLDGTTPRTTPPEVTCVQCSKSFPAKETNE